MDEGLGLGLKFCGLGLKLCGLAEKVGFGLELIITGLKFCWTGRGGWGLGGLNSSTSLSSTNIGWKAPKKVNFDFILFCNPEYSLKGAPLEANYS